MTDLVEKKLHDTSCGRNPPVLDIPSSSSSSTELSYGYPLDPSYTNITSLPRSSHSLAEARTRLKTEARIRMESSKDLPQDRHFACTKRLSVHQSRIRARVIEDLKSLIACEMTDLDAIGVDISRYERSLNKGQGLSNTPGAKASDQGSHPFKSIVPLTLPGPEVPSVSLPVEELYDDAVSEASISDTRTSWPDKSSAAIPAPSSRYKMVTRG